MPTYLLPITIDTPPLFSADDRILLGEGLFETIRVVEQRPCYPYLHWQRMRQSAMSLGIPFDISYKQWHEHLVHRIGVSELQNGGIKVILSGGHAARGLHEHGHTSSLLFEAFTYPCLRQALNIVSAPWRRDAKNPIYQLKSVNYLESILARRQALASGADDAFFYNLEHHVTETTIANLFVVQQNAIVTPMIASGVLGGIIRSRILGLCRDKGISCTEISLDNTTMIKADAVFVTNALQGIRLVKSIDGRCMPIHHPLITLLRRLLAKDKERWD